MKCHLKLICLSTFVGLIAFPLFASNAPSAAKHTQGTLIPGVVAMMDTEQALLTPDAIAGNQIGDDLADFPVIAGNQKRVRLGMRPLDACTICEGCNIPPFYECCYDYQDCPGGSSACAAGNECDGPAVCKPAPIYQGCRLYDNAGQPIPCVDCAP